MLNLEAEKAAKSIRHDQEIVFGEAGIAPCHWYLKCKEFKAWKSNGRSSMLWHIEDDESARTFLTKQLCMWLQDRGDPQSLVTFHIPQDGEEVFDNRMSIYRSVLAHFCLYFTKIGLEAPDILNRIGAWDHQTGKFRDKGKILCDRSEKNPAAAFELLKCACRDTPGTIYILVSIQDSINLGEDVALLVDLWRLLSTMQNPIIKAQCALKIFVTSHLLEDKDIPTDIPITDLDTDRQSELAVIEMCWLRLSDDRLP